MLNVDVLYTMLTFSAFGQVDAHFIITIKYNNLCFQTYLVEKSLDTHHSYYIIAKGNVFGFCH